VAIQSTSELEAVISRVIVKVEKHISERGSWPALEEAKRTFEQVRAVTRQGPKLKALREKLRAASEVVGTELPLESSLHEDAWDVEDYIDYRV
jgi:hypothetical protein